MEKVIVITGAGGVLCSGFAEFLAGKGNKAALLDLNEEAAKRVADKITAAGGNAKAYKCNVLDKANIEEVHGKVLEDLGKCDILINGAGGNNPKCTTAHEEYEKGDEQASDFLTFFNIDEKGFDVVFDLNIKGVLLPSQVFMADMIGRKGCSVLNISSMNAYRPLTKIPAYSAAKAAPTRSARGRRRCASPRRRAMWSWRRWPDGIRIFENSKNIKTERTGRLPRGVRPVRLFLCDRRHAFGAFCLPVTDSISMHQTAV